LSAAARAALRRELQWTEEQISALESRPDADWIGAENQLRHLRERRAEVMAEIDSIKSDAESRAGPVEMEIVPTLDHGALDRITDEVRAAIDNIRFQADVAAGRFDVLAPGVAELANRLGILGEAADGLTQEMLETNPALRELNDEMLRLGGHREAAAVIDATRTATERYGDEVKKLDDLLAQGLISQEQHSRAVSQAREALLGTGRGRTGGGGASAGPNEFEREVEAIRERTRALEMETEVIGKSALETDKARAAFELMAAAKRANLEITPELTDKIDHLAEAYAQAAETVRSMQEAQLASERLAQTITASLKESLSGFISDMRQGKDAAEALADAVGRLADRLVDLGLDMLLSGLFRGAGGFGGGILAGIFHKGGKVGGSGSTRTVSPAIFAGAPRYHSGGIGGLRPDEVPAILQRGELVIPRDMVRQTAERGAGAGAAPQVDVHVKNVNAFDAPGFLSQALDSEVGQRVLLNFVRANAGAVSTAIGRG
jgi:hypothetical protein